VVEAMEPATGVARVIPAGFDAYARVLHPLPDGQRWASAAPEYLEPGGERYRYPFPDIVSDVEGDLGEAGVDLLAKVLGAATATPTECHYGLWAGWGELNPGSVTVASSSKGLLGGLRAKREVKAMEETVRRAQAEVSAFVGSCPVQPWWGGRDMLLFDGPVEAVVSIGASAPIDGQIYRRRCPQWWWPEDHHWFVATEIDYPWTYVGGPAGLIHEIIEDTGLEGVEVSPADRW
jgi:hypothetical protein